MNEYVTLAWSLASFIAGAGAGLYLALRLTGAAGPPRTATLRRGFQWARSDVLVAPPPTAKETMVRRVTDWQNAATIEGRMLTFHIQSARDGFERDLTFGAHLILRFFKAGDDGPTREGFHGDNNDYSRLLSVARAYAWVIPDGRRYQWAIWLSTRERRVRVLEAWLSRGE